MIYLNVNTKAWELRRELAAKNNVSVMSIAWGKVFRQAIASLEQLYEMERGVSRVLKSCVLFHQPRLVVQIVRFGEWNNGLLPIRWEDRNNPLYVNEIRSRE